MGRETRERNEIVIHKLSGLQVLGRQFKNPLFIILIFATLVSFFTGQRVDALVIFSMILVSVVLGFWNEYSAEKAVSDLLKKISQTAIVLREGEKREIPVSEIVLEDKIYLVAGSIVPADLKLVEYKNLEIGEAVLTGESSPVVKNEKDNLAFMGTEVLSGDGLGEVVAIGKNTRYGKIAGTLSNVRPETEFQKGLRSYGGLIFKVVSIMAVVIFVVNALMGHGVVLSVLFALAIAIGLTPELMPVIVTVSLSRGAKKLAEKGIVVKQLTAIEDLGNMEVLCTDKTGTLTEGKISVDSFVNENGKSDLGVLDLALYANQAVIHHKVIGGSIDTALLEYCQNNNYVPPKVEKIFEEPFDYQRQMMFAVIYRKGDLTIISKGSPEAVLANCDISKEKKDEVLLSYQKMSQSGYRTIALATRNIEKKDVYGFEDLKNLKFQGLIFFNDATKGTAKEALEKLGSLGVKVKILTGDNEIVAEHVCKDAGISYNRILKGEDLEKMTFEKLVGVVWQVDIFSRVTPDQKLRIIRALQEGGHTIGFLGDGVNDGPALHVSDVGISVNTAIDVAKDAATVVLLKKSLFAISDGVMEGRKIFSNTIKYILMGTSSNFGNMFSAAGASFFLPFLPMTASQILFTNVLYDVSQLSIPSDNVDPEVLARPKEWDVNYIKKYMLFFGPISSLYDFMTFGVMIFVFRASGSFFQTGWFIESLITEIMVVFVIRTARTPFYKSRPGNTLIFTCLTVVILGLLLPFSPFASILSFTPLPPLYFGILILMTGTYLMLVERGKSILIRKVVL